MRLLLLSNMKPSKQNPVFGLFVQHQFAALAASDEFTEIRFLGIESNAKGKLALLLKYSGLMWRVLTQAVLCRQRFDIVHVHYYFPTIFYALMYKGLRNWQAKIVVTFHGSDIYAHPTPSILYRLAAKWIDHHIFVSAGLKQRFIHQSVAHSVLSAGILTVFRRQQVEKNFDLMMVGKLDHNKGMDRLLDLLATINQPLRVLVVGEGPYAEQLQKNVDQRHQLTMMAKCEPAVLANFFNQSYFLLNLSRHESFGLVMTEAMACAVPVIASLTDGAEAQIVNGYNGFVLDNDDSQLTTNDVLVIRQSLGLIDTEAYCQLADHAEDSVESQLMPKIVNELIKIYRRLS